jgi:hypothetical protein
MDKRIVLMTGRAVCLEFSVGCQRQTGLSKADRTAHAGRKSISYARRHLRGGWKQAKLLN